MPGAAGIRATWLSQPDPALRIAARPADPARRGKPAPQPCEAPPRRARIPAGPAGPRRSRPQAATAPSPPAKPGPAAAADPTSERLLPACVSQAAPALTAPFPHFLLHSLAVHDPASAPALAGCLRPPIRPREPEQRQAQGTEATGAAHSPRQPPANRPPRKRHAATRLPVPAENREPPAAARTPEVACARPETPVASACTPSGSIWPKPPPAEAAAPAPAQRRSARVPSLPPALSLSPSLPRLAIRSAGPAPDHPVGDGRPHGAPRSRICHPRACAEATAFSRNRDTAFRVSCPSTVIFG